MEAVIMESLIESGDDVAVSNPKTSPNQIILMDSILQRRQQGCQIGIWKSFPESLPYSEFLAVY